MRVAVVSGYDWSVPGGVQNQVASLATEMTRRGHEVAVVAPRRDPAAGPMIDGYAFFAAGRGIGIPVNGSVAPVAPTPGAAAAAIRALRAFGPEVVHVHEPLLPGPPLAAVLRVPFPIVATFHRADDDLLYRLEGRLLGAVAMRRCAALTAVSEPAAETARAVLGTAIRAVSIVPNGIELHRFDAARREQQSAEPRETGQRFKHPGGPTVAFVGRHERRKGADLLIRAAASLPADARVLISGDGPESASLRQLASDDDRVEFPGRIDDAAVARLMASADVVVAPARGGESFGLVIVEAMAAGTAVVCSDLPGYASAAGGAARLFRTDDSQDLARAVSEVLADDELRRRLVESGSVRAAACSIEAVAAQYEAVYESAISLRGRP